MLLRAGDLEASLAVLEEGHRLFPDDPWFPWILAMELWQEGDDPHGAAHWLRKAAQIAPDGQIYERAARALEREP